MNPKFSVLIIEDETHILNFMRKILTSHDYKVLSANTGKAGLEIISSQCPDIILLDLGLPDIDGVDIIKKVREWSSCPIIVISARTSEREKVLARIRTSLRHSNKMNTDSPMFIKPYHAKDLTIDFSKRLILLHEQEIHLTPIEYKIVACLAKNSGKVVTYSSIMSDVWGPYTDTDNKILRVNMANIRRKLETNPAEPTYIFTELGVGYRMKEDESE